MCGICGFVSKRNITLDELMRMNNTMAHRGPDDAGAEIYVAKNEYLVGLAQRRLSIMDLSDLGHQPMLSPEGRISVVFNGEIYNFRELKSELKFYPFRSNCDTEVIIAAYLKWGMDFPEKLNGMFAIALYDKETENLLLVRDRIGKKPLYYELERGKDGLNIYFASELKPIMTRVSFNKRIDKRVLSRYFCQQYINAPDTVFENVYKLEPGSILSFDISGKVSPRPECHKYWDIKTEYFKMQESPVTVYAEAKEQLKELLVKSVRARLMSDVPLGVFLSGGYDSTLIAAIAQSLCEGKLKTFTIGFNDNEYNEAGYAKEIAEYLGTEHTEEYISEEDMLSLVKSIPRYYDEPFADSSQISTMLVSKLAKKDVTVVLSGDGGDEFFCGYNVYDYVRKAQLLDGAGGLIYKLLNKNYDPVRNFSYKYDTHNADYYESYNPLLDRLPDKVRAIILNRNEETKTQFTSMNYIGLARSIVAGEKESCLFPFESSYGAHNWQIRRMLLDMDTYLPGDILCKVDRASMKYSLEARCPLLDKEVMEYSFRLKHKFKYSGGVKKRILKDIAYDYLPKQLLARPKTGFSVPLDTYLRGPLKQQLLDMCSGTFLTNQGLFDKEFVKNTVSEYLKKGDGESGTGRRYSRLIWSYFIFQQWYEEYFGN